MATLNQVLHRRNASGTYDDVYLRANLANVTGTLAVANGGTGATDAATARSNLGITPANIGAATSGHTHSTYAASGHNHDGVYSKTNHTHSNYITNDFKLIGTSTYTSTLNANYTSSSARYVNLGYIFNPPNNDIANTIRTSKIREAYVECDLSFGSGSTMRLDSLSASSYVTIAHQDTGSDRYLRHYLFSGDKLSNANIDINNKTFTRPLPFYMPTICYYGDYFSMIYAMNLLDTTDDTICMAPDTVYSNTRYLAFCGSTNNRRCYLVMVYTTAYITTLSITYKFYGR